VDPVDEGVGGGRAAWGGIQYSSFGYIDRWDGHRWRPTWVSASQRARLVAVSLAQGMTWAIGATHRGLILERDR
jgi:hypothetical protein